MLRDLPQLWSSLQTLEPENAAEDKLGQAQALNNLAFNESFLGRFEEAINHFNEALPLWGKDSDRVVTLVSLGKTLIDAGQFPIAIENYERLLRMLDSIPRQDASIRNVRILAFKGLGLAYYEIKQYAAATHEFEKALELRGISDKQQADIINSIAGTLTKSGRPSDLSRAEKEVRKAQQLWSKAGFKLGAAISDNNFGKLYEQRGNLSAAISSYNSALKIIEELTKEYGNNPDVLLQQVALYNLAHAQKTAHLLAEADANVGKAIDILEHTSSGFSDDEYRQVYFASRWEPPIRGPCRCGSKFAGSKLAGKR